MQTAQIPTNEAKRLIALYSVQMLDTPPEEAFDRITQLAARLFGVPIAAISLIDSDRQWFKSKVGVEVTQTSREHSFCGHVVFHEKHIVVNDATQDERFADNPFVTGANIKFYAGIPLLSIDQYVLGTLCIVDHVPRELKTEELDVLIDLAYMAQQIFQQYQMQYQVALSAQTVLTSLSESEARYRQLIEHSPDVFFLHDGYRIEFINQAGVRLLGAENVDQLIGRSVYDLVIPENRHVVQQRIASLLTTFEPNPMREFKYLRLDGTTVDVEASSICFLMNGRPVIQVMVRDNTFRKQYRDEMERMATHDVLTGLPNRAVLMDRLNQGIARWERRKQGAVVAFLNLDHFKNVNDTLGHSVGDHVLLTIAQTMLNSVRQNDTVARVGGDEFILILDDMPGDEDPVIVLQRLFNKICHQPITVLSQEITVSCSIGFCRYPEHGITTDALLNAADAAMYCAKALGRSTINPYQAEMQTQATERFTLENRLRLALKQDELILHYQPKVDLQTGKVVGLEALVRWQHPEMGLVPPLRFIPIAEETGIIVPMGEWILRTACEQALAWQQAGIVAMPVAVNLSARQFLQPDIVARIKDIIRTTGLAPHLLELELTESLSMDNPEKSIAVLTDLKNLGITITLDDFGTGYSNLSYLKRFPLDKLKLDRSFVKDIMQSNEALAISQAIIVLAHSLRLSVVAEGVETREQLSVLTEYGCDEMQGYFFSKPLSVEQCTILLKEKKQLESE